METKEKIEKQLLIAINAMDEMQHLGRTSKIKVK
jgi:hypothetical protein